MKTEQVVLSICLFAIANSAVQSWGNTNATSSSSTLLATNTVGTPPGSIGKPSEKSIRELLEVTKARVLLDDAMGQMEGYIRSMMQVSLKGRTLNSQEQQALDRAMVAVTRILKQEFTWEKWEPTYIKIYRDSLTQEEVDGLIALYQTPAGKAMITKMPVIMKTVMAEMQPLMERLYPKLEKALDEALEDPKGEPTTKRDK